MSELIDEAIFSQLLEMDDNDDHDFSKSLVIDYFVQVDESMEKFETLMKNKQFHDVAALGHYLKGSSAGIGALHIREICESIQHYENHIKSGKDGELYLKNLIDELKGTIEPTKKELHGRLGISY